MKTIEIIKTKYGIRKRVYTKFTDPSKTDQSFKEECDVNNCVRKFMKDGTFTHVSNKQPLYQDVSQMTDLHTASIMVKEAQEAFNALPPQLREKLNNDPVNLFSYLNDPQNDEEAIHYGLKERARPQYPEVSKQAEGAQANSTKTAKTKNPPNDDDSTTTK